MWMPKAPTLDPLEKFRMNHGVRHFGQVVKSLKNAAFLLRIVGKMVEEAGDDASVFGNVLGDIL